MTRPAALASIWQSIRRLPGRTPLRVKLITAVLALVGVAIALIGAAGVLVFRDYLFARADQQVRHQYRIAALAVQGGQPGVHLYPGDLLLGGSFITAWRFQGQQLNPQIFPNPSAPQPPLPAVPVSLAWVNAHKQQLLTVGGLNNADRWRVMVSPAQYVGPTGATLTGTLIVGVDLGDINGSIARLTTIELIVGALVLVSLAAIGIAVVRTSLRPLSAIEQTAQAIAAGDLGRRVPERDPRTEVGSLGRSLNTMLARIEAAFRAQAESEEAARRSEEAAKRSALAASRSEERMRRFVADASHELRTPLTTIRGFAEYYRQRGGDGRLDRDELGRMITRIEQEATRMGLLVDDMLLLARLDQQRPMEFRTVDLLAIAADALHDARVIAPSRTITLTVGTPQAALVTGDEASLRQVAGNLMSNALTHTPDGTPIEITIRSGTLDGEDGAATPAMIMEVRDSGPGLTSAQKEHVFERFYRTDRARSRAAGGTGLGLAIVAALVSAHHGRVWVESEPGKGATFGFAIPLAPEARHQAADSG